MNTSSNADAARLPILLTELRLPTIKRMWESIGEQSDREGWRAERLLSMLFEQEIDERAPRRLARHRLDSQLPSEKRLESSAFHHDQGGWRATHDVEPARSMAPGYCARRGDT
jgi:DNA replication protein DnaC